MAVSIINQQEKDITLFVETLQLLFDAKLAETKEFSIVFITSDEMHQYNLNYKKRDYVTDVLSFPTNNEIENDLGDILICLDKAIMQATQYQHSLLREVCFLAVHGYLHLLGYDHQTKEEESIMMQKTEEILALVALGKVCK